MHVTITSLKLRSLLGFFQLSWNGYKISQQAKPQNGFVKMKYTGFGFPSWPEAKKLLQEKGRAISYK